MRVDEALGFGADARAVAHLDGAAMVRPYVRDGLASDEVALLPRRSALVLRGRARSAWMHGIDPAANASCSETRVSATFRTIPS